MLFELFNLDNQNLIDDLRRVDNALLASSFLEGIRLGCKSISTDGFVSLNKINEMPMRIDGHDLYYNETHNFQNFTEILEEESGRIKFSGVLSHEESSNVFMSTMEPCSLASELTWEYIENRMKSLDISSMYQDIATRFNLDVDEILWMYETCFLSVIHNEFIFLLDAVLYGGLDNSPLALRMLEAYETGGMPGGWVGPLPKEGGKPKDCLQLFHFGGTS